MAACTQAVTLAHVTLHTNSPAAAGAAKSARKAPEWPSDTPATGVGSTRARGGAARPKPAALTKPPVT